MTTQTMTPLALELLQAAEREYEVDNDRESARLLAEATAALLDMLAESRGISLSDDYTAMARELDKKEGNGRHHFFNRLSAGEDLLEHSETGGMEDYGMVEWLHITQGEFIRDTLRELGFDVPPAPAKWSWSYYPMDFRQPQRYRLQRPLPK
ncbi:MAG: hypothetical protein OXC95_06070 [Dehalococcoidia bacterium]|nr:hypothetical protein [Dehalococcoidia bacterium]